MGLAGKLFSRVCVCAGNYTKKTTQIYERKKYIVLIFLKNNEEMSSKFRNTVPG